MRRFFAISVATLFSFALAILALTPPVHADGPGPNMATPYVALISGAAFTGKAINAAKTFDAIDVGGYETVIVEVAYTYSAATQVLMTCLEGPTAAGAVFKVPEASGAGLGVVDHYQRTWRWTTGAASASFFFEVPTVYRFLTCTFTGTAADANDKITVTLRVQG
jgi:hypothetical protein